jgi:hypothetical protein
MTAAVTARSIAIKEGSPWITASDTRALVTVAPSPAPTRTPTDAGSKRNSRPGRESDRAAAASPASKVSGPQYAYEFDRPGFVYGRVNIEHDDAGRGTISFVKQGYADAIKDPIALSAVTMDKLRQTFDALNFIDSAENYQHEKDFSHMGNVSISLKRLKRDGRTRTAKYNWTDNKLAKELMDEYRRISNEYTWRFEMSLARENHPLDVPGLMETMDRYIARGEISDPQHILPLLEQFSTDERIPLMARNRAAKIVKQIAKSK